MSNRILDYPEATAITSDDYILLDNAGTGAKCIKASALNINMDNYTIKEASGAIASFDDGEDLPLAFMGAYITALQDLHGYDYPWVGGSGKNKFDDSNYTTSTYSKSGDFFTNTQTDTRTFFAFVLKDAQDVTLTQSNITSTGLFVSNSFTTSATNSQLTIKHNGATKDLGINFVESLPAGTYKLVMTVNGVNPSTNNGLSFGNIMIINANESDTTYSPYSNICPIIGWDEVNVTRCGKNLCGELEIGTFAESSQIGLTYDEMKVANGARIRSKWLIPTFNNNIVISCDFANYQYCFCLYDANKKYLGQTDGFGSWRSIAYTPTTPSSYIAIVLKRNDGATITSDDLENCHLQVELGTTATTYEPYNGNTYTLTFTDGTNPLKVYYGKVDLISGILTINKCGDDMGNMNYTYQSLSGGRNGFSVSISDMKETIGGSEIIDAISSCYKATNYNGTWANGNMSYFYPTGKTVIFINNDYTDASTFKTTMTGQQFVYPLATPLTYQLTPTMIYSLIGENNIFADTGDSIVDYRKLWIKPEM